MRFASTYSFLTLMCMVCPVVAADKSLIVEIWPGKVPDETGDIGAEKVRLINNR